MIFRKTLFDEQSDFRKMKIKGTSQKISMARLSQKSLYLGGSVLQFTISPVKVVTDNLQPTLTFLWLKSTHLQQGIYKSLPHHAFRV